MKIRYTTVALAAFLAAVLFAIPPQTFAGPPPLTDLGTLGGSFANPVAINAAGQVVGSSFTAGNAESHAFIWDATHGMKDLGTLGGSGGTATAINAVGQVVGYSYVAGNLAQHAFLWDAAHGMQDLGTLGGSYSAAVGINSAGHVVGSAAVSGDGEYHAFLWDSTHGMQDLGGGGNRSATAVNEANQVIGQIIGSPFPWPPVDRAFFWDATHGMQDLGTLGGSTYAIALNDAGQVVGQSELPGISLSGGFPGPPVNHAFLWDSTHGINDLGTLGGSFSVATAINSAGQVVGSANTPFSNHPFVWDAAHGMQDLGTLGGTSGGGAAGINAAGQIVGSAFITDNSAPHAFVWDAAHGVQDLGTLGGSSGSNAIAINASGQIVGLSFLPGNTASHPFIFSTAVSPFAAMTALLGEMKAYLPSVTNKDDAKKLAEAIAKLKDSLNPSFWSADGMHLVAKTGEHVFNGEKETVGKLQELIKKNPASSATLQGFIKTVVDADRILAKTAITDASGSDKKKIAQANAELAKGDANKALGKFADAIDNYRNAWKKALEARG